MPMRRNNSDRTRSHHVDEFCTSIGRINGDAEGTLPKGRVDNVCDGTGNVGDVRSCRRHHIMIRHVPVKTIGVRGRARFIAGMIRGRKVVGARRIDTRHNDRLSMPQRVSSPA